MTHHEAVQPAELDTPNIQPTDQASEAAGHQAKGHPAAGKYGRNPFTGLVQAAKTLAGGGSAPLIVLASVWALTTAGPLLLENYQHSNPIFAWSGYAICMLLSLFSTLVQIGITLRLARHEQPSLSAAIKLALRRLLKLIGLGLLTGFFMGVGFVFFFIPGILLAFWLSFGQYIVIDTGAGPWSAIKQSFELLYRNLRHVVGIQMLLGVAVAAVIVFGLIWPVWGTVIGQGLLVALTMICGIYMIWVYDDLTYQRKHNLPSQTVSPGNILAIVVAVVAYMLGLAGLIAYLVIQTITTKQYATPCYKLDLPPVFQIKQNDGCHLVLKTSLETDEFKAVDEPLYSADQVNSTLPTKYYPNGRYQRTNLIKPEYDTRNGVDMYVESLRDRQTKEDLTAAYLFAPQPYVIDGQTRRVFIFSKTLVADQSGRAGLAEITASAASFYDHVTWVNTSPPLFHAHISDVQGNYNTNQHTDAVKDAQDALAVADLSDFDRSVGLKWLGLAQHSAKQDADARISLTQSMKLYRYDTEVITGLAGVEYASGHYQLAITLCGQALAIDDQSGEAYNVRGLAKSELGDKTGAVADLSQALKISPDDPTIKLNLEQVQ